MTCPACDGTGRVVKRFLWVFTRLAPCAQCLGTGRFPPPPVQRILDRDDRFQRDDGASSAPAPVSGAADRSESFAVGDSGRSGGGGGGASWDDGGGPLIADPFTGGDSSAAAIAANDTAVDDAGSASDGSGSSAGETSY